MSLVSIPRKISTDPDGAPRVGAKWYFYEPGTDTPIPTYTTADMDVEHPWPVVSQSNGYFPAVYIDPTAFPSHKQVILDADGLTIFYDDNVPTEATTLRQELASTTAGNDGARLSGYRRTETGARTDASVWTALSRSIALTDFAGVDASGVSSSHVGFASWWAAVKASPGGYAVIPPGMYLFTTQALMDGSSLGNTMIEAAGAEFYTTGALAALQISFSATPHILALHNLKVNHRGNADAAAGIELFNTANVRLYDCTVEAHGVGASYAAFLLRNGTPADTNTGCFWTVLKGCTVRKRTGSDVGDIPYGVWLRGAANASTIESCNIGGTVTKGIYISPESGQTYISNGVLIHGGTAFEGGTDAIYVDGSASVGISGMRVIGCRCEAYTSFINLQGTTVGNDGATRPFFAGNYLIPGVTYLTNPNSLQYVSLDSSHNPAQGWHADLGGSFDAYNTTGSGAAAISARVTSATAPAISVRSTANTEIIRLREGSTNAMGRINGQAANNSLELTGVAGISQNGTAQENLSGTATFAAATTVAVTFSVNEADGNYKVMLTPHADPVGRLWVTGKSITGFTINNSSATSITVGWALVR